MPPENDWFDTILNTTSYAELREALEDNLNRCLERVATGRAKVLVLEKIPSSVQRSDDKIVDRLRAYGMNSDFPWSSIRGQSLDIAELAEDLEAAKQFGDPMLVMHRATLFELVIDKLDLDQCQGIIDSLDDLPEDEREKVAADIRDGTKDGMNQGASELIDQEDLITGDGLAGYKLRANLQLGNRRFALRPPRS